MFTSDVFVAMLVGLLTGLSLIMAIGAQNSFLLRQAVARQYVGMLVLFFTLSDAVVITAGVGGVAAIVNQFPEIIEIVRWFGVIFLTGFALFSFRRALRKDGALTAAEGSVPSRRSIFLTAVAMTWLNPHVYLDALTLGALAANHGDMRWWFAVGCLLASAIWFTGVGYGARLLTPLFAKAKTWRILDGAIGVTMLWMGLRLAF